MNLTIGNSNFENGFLTSNKNNKPFGIELAFTTSDVEKLIDKALENGAERLTETEIKKLAVYVHQFGGGQ